MEKINKLKNKYKGKRIFIIGNGPSLKNTDLDLLKDEYTFSMNRISQIFNSTKWRPFFFLCTTENIKKPEWRADIDEGILSSKYSFVWDSLESGSDLNKVIKIRCNNGSEITKNAPDSWWSTDPEFGFSKFGTSMLVSLQLSSFMGFSEIYILGADLGFKNNLFQRILYKFNLKNFLPDNNHFTKGYGTPGFNSKILNNNMLAAHKLAKKNLLKEGVKVYNATVGGKLEIYERVDYKTLF